MVNFIQKKIFTLLRKVAKNGGFTFVKWKSEPHPIVSDLPVGAAAYLVDDNPDLLKLIADYNRLQPDVTNSVVWNWKKGGIGSNVLRMFRGDHAYVWQLKGIDIPEFRYLATTYYQWLNDKMNLMNLFSDDSLFGNILFNIRGKAISREVLDSSNEINFVEKHLSLLTLKDFTVLDIGAGYGRLAHRFSEAYSNLNKYYCTDGVPVSAFICDYYLKFRNVKNAEVVAMPFLQSKLNGERIDLALNIHSFSECSLDSIEWWISLISHLGIPYLMVVPNAFEDGGAQLLTNKREDFSFIFEKYNYELVVKEPKYSDPMMQQLGLYPTYYYLFKHHSSVC